MFPFRNPEHCRITCVFGKPGSWKSGRHDGIDIVCSSDKSIIAVASGSVIRSGYNESWGQYIVTQLSDGRALVYAHLSGRGVSVGEFVKTGDYLGRMGSTGNSSGAHLHIELQKQYYKCGFVDDIAAYLGIKNEVGKVAFLADQPSSWAAAAWEKATAAGLIDGSEPHGTLTREQLIVILERLALLK